MKKIKRLNEYLPHLIGLFIIIVLPLFIFDSSEEKIMVWTYRYYLQAFILSTVFYLNYLILVPKFFISKQRIKFTLSLIMISLIFLVTSQIVSKNFDHPPHPENRKRSFHQEQMQPSFRDKPNAKTKILGLHPRMLDEMLLLILVFGFSTGMRIIQKNKKEEELQKELEKNNVETELAFLKNQINPHFFFNSLNNIYALVAIDGDQAQKAIEELSGLMRYLIYESNVKLVPLRKEFEFTSNYIELMKKRVSAKVKLSIAIQKNIPNVQVPPLLFISFIENAFKHGISYREKSFIDIQLFADEEKIFFVCNNSIPQNKEKKSDDSSGVGIANSKKRLDLLYGNSAKLNIKENETFTVNLTIPVCSNKSNC